jgi:hypothetical protein
LVSCASSHPHTAVQRRTFASSAGLRGFGAASPCLRQSRAEEPDKSSEDLGIRLWNLEVAFNRNIVTGSTSRDRDKCAPPRSHIELGRDYPKVPLALSPTPVDDYQLGSGRECEKFLRPHANKCATVASFYLSLLFNTRKPRFAEPSAYHIRASLRELGAYVLLTARAEPISTTWIYFKSEISDPDK